VLFLVISTGEEIEIAEEALTAASGH